ncbi:hypothetical protein FOCG_18041 [Fusarium oxysporum f. sp. radicis-lycopersici 26381]|nr:hypothetical protein FOCG_18041 [Fusarium oxysporum f. sp. radicis-lycopersici 26381]
MILGELLIECPHLAREYLNDATETTKSFVTDPDFFSDLGLESTSGRMYRTDDDSLRSSYHHDNSPARRIHAYTDHDLGSDTKTHEAHQPSSRARHPTRQLLVEAKDFNRLVPIGASSELLTEEPLLAHAYLGDEVKTAKFFLIDPYITKHHGLQAGRRIEGSYTPLGHRDTQIKIRGHRVEFGEIEYWVVRPAPEISQAAVMLLSGPVGRSSVLTVMLETVDGGENSDVDNNLQGLSQADLLEPTITMRESFEEVRGYLISILPRYMVPDIFTTMSRLPLNSSGKLDRRAIDLCPKGMKPEDLDICLPNAAAKANVSTEVGRQLQHLWASVLGRPANTVGATDSFFHLGSDYITTMRLVEASSLLPPYAAMVASQLRRCTLLSLRS